MSSPAIIGDAEVRAFAVSAATREVERIFALFPEVRAQYGGANGARPAARPPVPEDRATVDVRVETPRPPRRRPQMTPRQRAAVSKRMRAYWAARRAATTRK